MDDFNKQSTPQPAYCKPENRVAGDAGSGAGTAARMKLADKAADLKDRVAPGRSPCRHLKCNDPYPKSFRTSSGTSKRSSARSFPPRQDRIGRESVRRSPLRQTQCRLAPRFLWTWFPAASRRLCLGRHHVHLARRIDRRRSSRALRVDLHQFGCD